MPSSGQVDGVCSQQNTTAVLTDSVITVLDVVTGATH